MLHPLFFLFEKFDKIRKFWYIIIREEDAINLVTNDFTNT